MLYGTVPFKGSNIQELQKQIVGIQTSFKDEISKEAMHLLKAILVKDPEKRLTCKQILQHPWMKDCPQQLDLFTKDEKQRIHNEFDYYRQNYNEMGAGVDASFLQEKGELAAQSSLVKNVSEKSIIMAPFNSTRSNIVDILNESVKAMLIDKKKYFKLAPQVKDVDRAYEMNNNGQLDNGVYHQDSDDEEQKKKGDSFENSFHSIASSVSGDKDLDAYIKNKEEGVFENPPVTMNSDERQDTDWEKFHKDAFIKKTEEDCPSKELQQENTLVINEAALNQMEKAGYPKKYSLQKLNKGDLNHCTAFYHLLSAKYNFWKKNKFKLRINFTLLIICSSTLLTKSISKHSPIS